MDGSIERGYSGRSFFYDNYKILYNDRTEMYARLMASIGINAIVINNVNVHEKETYLITDVYLKQVKQYTDLFARYGIRLFMSVNFAAPMELSDIPISDPLDPQVIAWWGKARGTRLLGDSKFWRIFGKGRFRRPSRSIYLWTYACGWS